MNEHLLKPCICVFCVCVQYLPCWITNKVSGSLSLQEAENAIKSQKKVITYLNVLDASNTCDVDTVKVKQEIIIYRSSEKQI